MRIAINGFGRIGRAAFKVALAKTIEVAAVNDLSDPATLAHLLKYDSMYGRYHEKVEVSGDNLIVAGQTVKILKEKDPSRLPWGSLEVDVVLECTGRFTTLEDASLHLNAGAKRVIISAPAKGPGVPTIVRGVNHDRIDASHAVVNNASCTTNCMSPIVEVIHSAFGVVKAAMTTIHSYTADQNLQDGSHRDLRRARAAAVNIIPTTTGAAIATTEVLPELVGKFDGLAIRVPTAVVSLSDVTLLVSRKVTAAQVNEAFERAAATPRYQGILAVTREPLVSSDFIGNTYSAVVDASLTNVVAGDLVKVIAWYDNELGYSHRLIELVLDVARTL